MIRCTYYSTSYHALFYTLHRTISFVGCLFAGGEVPPVIVIVITIINRNYYYNY